MLKVEFLHREIGDVSRGQSRPHSDSRRSDKTIRLVESYSTLGVRAPPTACTFSLGRTKRGQAQRPKEATCGGFLLGLEASPYFLN